MLTTPRHPYTRALIASLPNQERKRRRPIAGEPPSPLRRPPGCAFHPRCALAVPACKTDVPLLETVGEGHVAACPIATDAD